MALREIETHVRFAGGVETKSDPKSVPATKLLALENGVFGRAISIKKRNGYEEATTFPEAKRLGARGDELLAFTGNRCFSKRSGSDQTSDVGAVFSAIPRERPLVRTGTQQLQPDHATVNGVTVSAWMDSRGGVWWSVLDAVSGRVFRQPEQADANGISPRCVAVGGNLHVYYALDSVSRIMALVINPDDPTAAIVPTVLVDDLNSTNPVYDAVESTRSGTPAVIAWAEDSTTNLRLGYVTGAGNLGSPLNGNPSVVTVPATMSALSPIAVTYRNVDGGNADMLAVAWLSGTSGMAATAIGGNASTGDPIDILATDTLVTVVACRRIAIAIAADADDPDDAMLWTAWEEFSLEPTEKFVRVNSMEWLSGSIGTEYQLRSVGLASSAWAIGTDAFVMLIHDSTYFNTYVSVALSAEGVPVGRHAPGLGASPGVPPERHLSSAHVDGSTVSISASVRDRLISENANLFRETGVKLITMDFDSDSSHQTVVLGRGLYLGGACLMHYDGRIWTEQGFHVGPELIIATPANGSGTMTSNTTYLYRAWYEWTDAQGEVHRGPVSIGTLVTMGASDDEVSLQLPTLRLTRKPNVRIMVARSLAALTGDTERLFRVTSLDPNDAADPANGYIENDTTVDFVTFVDRMPDATLRQQDEIYTDGGILSNDPAPCGALIARAKSRLIVNDPSDGSLVRVSQIIEDGYGVELPPDIVIRCDPQGGDITALSVMDDRVIVFKRDAIFTFNGDGPLPNGDTATSGFSQPMRMVLDIGCTEPASVVEIPDGLMFKSAKGIQLLAGTSLVRQQHEAFGSTQYIGSPVEAYNGQTVRRAMTMPDRTQVAFLTDDGLTLLYDYLFSQWSTFTNHEGLDSVVVEGAYHYLRNDGRLFKETIGAYSDAGQRITLRFETAPFHFQEQLHGFVKFFELFVLGTWISPHQLGIQYRTDYNDQWIGQVWLDATGDSSSSGWITGTGAATIGVEPITGTGYGDGAFGDGAYGGTPLGLYQWRLDLYEKGSSIAFRIEDYEKDGLAGASFEISELLLTGGVERNAPKPWSAGRSI